MESLQKCLSQKSLTSEGSQLYPFLVLYSNVFLDGIIVCEERISIKQAPFAASSAYFKAALVQRSKTRQTPGQLCDRGCCLHFQKRSLNAREAGGLQLFTCIFISLSGHLWPIKALLISSLHSHVHTFIHADGREHTNQPGETRQLEGQDVALRRLSKAMRVLEPPVQHHQRETGVDGFEEMISLRDSTSCSGSLFLLPRSLAPSLSIYESIKCVSHALPCSIIPSRLFYTAASLWGSYTSCSWEEMAASLLFL